MATKQVEARLTVKAVNHLSAPLKQMGEDTGTFGKKAKAEFNKLDELRGPIRAIEDYRTLGKSALESMRQLAEAQKRVKDLDRAYKDNPTGASSKALEAARRTAGNIAAKYEKRKDEFKAAKEHMSQFGITASNVAGQERELAGAVQSVSDNLDNNWKKFKEISEKRQKWKDAKAEFSRSMGVATGMAASGGSALYSGQRMVRAAYDPISKAASFDEAMQGVQAVTRTFSTSNMSESERKKRDGEYKSLRKMAKDLGASTSFTDIEVAGAETFLGQAGMKVEDILSSLPSVLNLSKAGRTDLARTADISSNVQSTYGIKDMSRIADVMVGTFTRSNVNVDQIGDSIKYSGAAAKQAGVEFEFLSAMIGKLGDNGRQGSMAGTALNAIINRLAGPPKMAAKQLKLLGIETKDVEGNLRPFPELLAEIKEKTDQLGSAERLEALKKIAGMEAAGSLGIILQNLDAVNELTGKLKEAKGEAAEIATAMMDQARGDEAITNSALSALKTEIGSQLMPEYRELQKTIADTLNKTRDWAAANPELTKTFVKLGAAVGGLLAAGGAAMIGLAGVYGTIALLKLTFKGAALARGFNTFGSALDDYSVKAEKAAVKTHGLKTSMKGIVGKAGLLNAVTLGFAAYETGQAFSDMKRLDEMSPEEKAASKKKLDDKLSSQNKAAENLPGIGWLYKKTMSAHKAMFGDGEPKTDLAAKRDDLAELDRRIAALKRTAIGPQAGEMLTGPLRQQREELVAEIDRLSQGVVTAGLDEATRQQADGVRASGLPETMKQTAVQIKGLALAASSGGASEMPKRALDGAGQAEAGTPSDLANLRDDLTDVDRRIAMIKQSAVSPQVGNVIAAPLMQERSELVVEIDRLTQGLAMAGLDEATRMQADGVRASGLPEALRQTAGQIRQLSFASAPDGAGAARFGAPVKVSPLTEPTLPARALGGSVKAGQTYQVNEHGRGETLVSDLSGRILSHTESMRSVRAAAQGSSGASGSGAAGRHSAAPSVGASAGEMPQVHMHLSVSPQVSVDASGGAIDEASLVRLMEREMAQFANSPQMAGAMRAMLTRLWRETQLTSYQNGALV